MIEDFAMFTVNFVMGWVKLADALVLILSMGTIGLDPDLETRFLDWVIGRFGDDDEG